MPTRPHQQRKKLNNIIHIDFVYGFSQQPDRRNQKVVTRKLILHFSSEFPFSKKVFLIQSNG
ncbi:hypothetical protein OIU76_023778, partial [Salix suchowensis]